MPRWKTLYDSIKEQEKMNKRIIALTTLITFYLILISIFFSFNLYGISNYTKVYLIEESPKYLEPPNIYEYIEKDGFNWERHYLYKDMKDDFEIEVKRFEDFKINLQKGLIKYGSD